jgi:hypothetical protein
MELIRLWNLKNEKSVAITETFEDESNYFSMSGDAND